MKAELISVGTEILLGEIADTNAVKLGQFLAQKGIDVVNRQTVGDNKERIEEALEIATRRSDLIITIGGLGPTEDDLTKDAVADFVGDQLKFDQNTLDKITDYFEKSNIEITSNNKKQAEVFANGGTLANEIGLAAGSFIENNNHTYVVLPGPPSEFTPMVNGSFNQFLVNRFNLNQQIKSKTLHFVGIGESLLADKLDDLINRQTNPTIALYFKDTDVTVRLTAKGTEEPEIDQLLNQTESDINKLVGEFYYSDKDEIDFPSFVTQELIKRELSITSAESLTGGLFQSTIVGVAGASTIFPGGYVTYSDASKHSLLGVSEATISDNTVVSGPVAKEMAIGAKNLMGTSIGVSFTGVAGPDGLEGHPAGEVWIGLALPNGDTVQNKYVFNGNRQKIRQRSVNKAFELIWRLILK